MAIRFITPTSTADYSTIAELHNLARITPVTPEELYETEMRTAHDSYYRRTIALDDDNHIVGTSLVRPHWQECFLSISTDPAYLRQGIGRALYDNAVTYISQHTSAPLITILRDDRAEGYSFAQARGFTLRQHWAYFQLDLTAFQTERFADIIPDVQRRGIRFFSFADAGNTLENQRKLYDLNRRTSLDAPGEESFPAFEEFAADVYNADWFRADGQIVAADGDQWVGLGAVGIDSDHPANAFNAFTGVDRNYRRRHIATALTLLTIEYAQKHNATNLRVFNDARNNGMIVMQGKLGYQPIPGRYIMTKPPLVGE